jgi:hypothetical protein
MNSEPLIDVNSLIDEILDEIENLSIDDVLERCDWNKPLCKTF